MIALLLSLCSSFPRTGFTPRIAAQYLQRGSSANWLQVPHAMALAISAFASGVSVIFG